MSIKNRIDSSEILKVSLLLYMASVMFQQSFQFIFGGGVGVLAIRIACIVLAVIYRIKAPCKNRKRNFAFFILLSLIPFLYNNYDFQDYRWLQFFGYIFAIIYAIIVYKSNISKQIYTYTLKVFVLFGLITSIFSWLEYISFDTYTAIVKNLFPSDNYRKMVHSFTAYGNLCGLAINYSRNAFLVVMGVICELHADMNKKRKITIIAFFLITLLSIGKRGHILFLALSLGISYLIIKKISIKTIAKIIGLSLVLVVSFFALSSHFPQISHSIDRFVTEKVDDDISNGRFEMYSDIRDMYKNNNYLPIGWGAYSKSTNYYHPALHNDYLQLYYETGIVGFSLVIIPNIAMFLYSAKKARNNNSYIYSIALTYNTFFLLYSITGMPHYDHELYFTYFILNAFIYNQGDSIQ